MLPVWMTNHYVFVEVTPQLTVKALGDDSFNIKFRPGVIDSAYTDSIFKNGAADNGLTIEIFVHCYKYDENGVRVEVEELHFVLDDEYIAKTYTELSPDGKKLAFGLTIKGATDEIADEYVVSYAVRSNRGVSYLVAEEAKYTFKPNTFTGAEN